MDGDDWLIDQQGVGLMNVNNDGEMNRRVRLGSFKLGYKVFNHTEV